MGQFGGDEQATYRKDESETRNEITLIGLTRYPPLYNGPSVRTLLTKQSIGAVKELAPLVLPSVDQVAVDCVYVNKDNDGTRVDW